MILFDYMKIRIISIIIYLKYFIKIKNKLQFYNFKLKEYIKFLNNNVIYIIINFIK